MYGFLWHHLPGRWPVRLAQLALLAVGVLALLFYVVFPTVDPHLPFNDVTVQNDQPAPSAAPTGSPAPGGATTPASSPAATPSGAVSPVPTGSDTLPGD